MGEGSGIGFAVLEVERWLMAMGKYPGFTRARVRLFCSQSKISFILADDTRRRLSTAQKKTHATALYFRKAQFMYETRKILIPKTKTTPPYGNTNNKSFEIEQLVDQCDELLEPVQALDSSLEDLWILLDDAGELSSCENVNGLYQGAVYNELCKDLPRGLFGFWVSCVLLTILLLILVRVRWR